MKLFMTYLRSKLSGIVLFFLFFAIDLAVFLLGELPLAAMLYPLALCALFGTVYLLVDFLRTRQSHQTLCNIQSLSALLPEQLPVPKTVLDADYQALLTLLQDEAAQRQSAQQESLHDMTDYYTAWAHQIKTPISAMKLALQTEDSAFSRSLRADLLRIEQYVQMVLTYLRLDADSTDYVFRTQKIDEILRPVLRRLAPEFIGRKLQLDYAPIEDTVLTDEKWLAFVVEQLLANALKYTPRGMIHIYMEAPHTLCIADTGIGIAAEDLPRIFEKGYTGSNGRTDKTASGIGLYLCRRICQNLGIEISAASQVGAGTTIRLTLQK